MSNSLKSLPSRALLGLALLFVPLAGIAAAPPALLQVGLEVQGSPRRAGDRATATATLTNYGAAPLENVILMLSLADASGSPAVPLGVEDWTPTPDAVHAVELGRGARLTGSWPLRVIQAGRLEVFATAIVGETRSVTNSTPIILNIKPSHNLAPATVLSVALGIPVLVLGGVGGVLRNRRRGVEA